LQRLGSVALSEVPTAHRPTVNASNLENVGAGQTSQDAALISEPQNHGQFQIVATHRDACITSLASNRSGWLPSRLSQVLRSRSGSPPRRAKLNWPVMGADAAANPIDLQYTRSDPRRSGQAGLWGQRRMRFCAAAGGGEGMGSGVGPPRVPVRACHAQFAGRSGEKRAWHAVFSISTLRSASMPSVVHRTAAEGAWLRPQSIDVTAAGRSGCPPAQRRG